MAAGRATRRQTKYTGTPDQDDPEGHPVVGRIGQQGVHHHPDRGHQEDDGHHRIPQRPVGPLHVGLPLPEHEDRRRPPGRRRATIAEHEAVGQLLRRSSAARRPRRARRRARSPPTGVWKRGETRAIAGKMSPWSVIAKKIRGPVITEPLTEPKQEIITTPADDRRPRRPKSGIRWAAVGGDALDRGHLRRPGSGRGRRR